MLVLISTCHDECCFSFCMDICYFKFLLWNLGHHTLFYLLCEITCHIAFLFTDIYLFTHTCYTPWLAKFRGSFCLDVCKSCMDDSNWNSNSCIHQGGALHKFWGSKGLNSIILIKSLSCLSPITKKGRLKVHLSLCGFLVYSWHPN